MSDSSSSLTTLRLILLVCVFYYVINFLASNSVAGYIFDLKVPILLGTSAIGIMISLLLMIPISTRIHKKVMFLLGLNGLINGVIWTLIRLAGTIWFFPGLAQFLYFSLYQMRTREPIWTKTGETQDSNENSDVEELSSL